MGSPTSATDEVRQRLGIDARSTWRRRLVVTSLLALALGALAFFGIRWYRSDRGDQPRYVTEKVTRGPLDVVVTATGTLEAADAVDVSSEISGRVLRVLVDFNQQVKKGDLLAELDPIQLRADVEQTAAQVTAAEANVRQAEVGLAEARQNLERANEQRKLGLVSQQSLEAAQTARERAEANLNSARASVRVARAQASSATWRLSRARILAPIDGMVLARSVEPGQTVVSAMQAPTLFKLAASLENLELHVQIDEADIGRVREGMPATFAVDAYPGKSFSTSIAAIRNEPVMAQNVVSYEAVLEVKNAERLLRPGMTATANIVTAQHADVRLVPNAALLFTPPASEKGQKGPKPAAANSADSADGKEHAVYVLRDGKPTKVVVEVGDTDGRKSELLSAQPAEGQEVVIDMIESS